MWGVFMSITNINNVNNVNDLNKIVSASMSAKTTISEDVAQKVRQDTFEKTPERTKDETGIYSKESIIEQLKNSEEQRVKAFQDTIKSMMVEQGANFTLTFRGSEIKLNVSEEQRLAAEKSISEGGEYSVSAVSDRIMNMAKALAGDDSSKLSLLKNAVIKGFNSAADLFGKSFDDMPSITKDTYNEVMNRFDEWEKSFAEESAEASE